MADSSFDVVSKVDKMEADNALHQAQKEIEQRYDFKNVGASVDWSGEKLLLKASTEERVKAVLDVLESKFIKRSISLKHLDVGEQLAFASQGERLEPGDVISTGTMPGCCGLELDRWIQPGQTVELEIDGIGTLANRIDPDAGPRNAVIAGG